MVYATIVLALLGAVAKVNAHAASPLAVAVAVEQFKNAKITPDVFSNFKPIGLLGVNYTQTAGVLTVGQDVSRGNVTNAPTVLIRGTEAAEATLGGPFNVSTIKYTVLCIDGNTAGSSNPNGYNLHYLENNLAYGQNRDHTVTLNSPGSAVVPYAAPNPPSGSGPHRYIWLAYAQPNNFMAPSTPAPGSGVALFNLGQYTAAANLGDPLAGTYFTVQQGPANVSVASTTAVDSKTLPQYTATSSGASATQTRNAAAAGKAKTAVVGGWMASVGGVAGILLAL